MKRDISCYWRYVTPYSFDFKAPLGAFDFVGYAKILVVKVPKDSVSSLGCGSVRDLDH